MLRPWHSRVRPNASMAGQPLSLADRGLLLPDNLDALTKIKTTGQRGLEFILAVPGRRNSEFTAVLQDIQAKARATQQEVIEGTRLQGFRLSVAHHQQRAAERTRLRNERMAALHAQAQSGVSVKAGAALFREVVLGAIVGVAMSPMIGRSAVRIEKAYNCCGVRPGASRASTVARVATQPAAG